MCLNAYTLSYTNMFRLAHTHARSATSLYLSSILDQTCVSVEQASSLYQNIGHYFAEDQYCLLYCPTGYKYFTCGNRLCARARTVPCRPRRRRFRMWYTQIKRCYQLVCTYLSLRFQYNIQHWCLRCITWNEMPLVNVMFAFDYLFRVSL